VNYSKEKEKNDQLQFDPTFQTSRTKEEKARRIKIGKSFNGPGRSLVAPVEHGRRQVSRKKPLRRNINPTIKNGNKNKGQRNLPHQIETQLA